MGKNPRPPGRPVLPPGEKLGSITLRLKPADIEKLKALGGRHWVQEKLKKAKA